MGFAQSTGPVAVVPQVIEAQSAQDLVQPSVERAVGVDGIPSPIRPDERVLREIEGIVVRSHEPQRPEVRSTHVPVDQDAERLMVASLHAEYQRPIVRFLTRQTRLPSLAAVLLGGLTGNYT
jgi:hypothetical protein